MGVGGERSGLCCLVNDLIVIKRGGVRAIISKKVQIYASSKAVVIREILALIGYE